MQRYVLGRIAQAVVTLFLLSILVFLLARLTGSPLDVLMPMEATEEDFERMAKHLGLDKPLVVQYLVYAGRALKGDFGKSIKAKIPVSQLLRQRLPNTIRLAAFTIAVAMFLALVFGIGAAVYRGSIIDTLCRILAVSGMSIPVFWLGIMAILVFAVHFGLLPSFGAGGIKNYVLPGCVMGWTFAAPLMRLVRSSMLEVLDSEYVKLARIKGVAEWRTIWVHALRNALIPVVTFAGFYLGLLMGGVVITETVFAWPGVGLLAYESVVWKDYPVIQGVVLFIGAAILTINLAVDILYAYLDPRIRY